MPWGDGTGFAKNWETMGLAWHNSSGTALGEDKMAKIYNHLVSIDQDELGMIYNSHNIRENSFLEIAEGAGVPQGWSFPSYWESTDDPTQFGKLRSLGSTSFEFNNLKDWQSEKWVAEGGKFEIDENTGYAYFSTDTLGVDDTFRFYRTDIEELIRAGGVMSEYSPFVELALDFKGNNLEDYYLIWKTKEGGDEWFSVAHNFVATTSNEAFSNYTDRCYLEMYFAENWDKQVITSIGLEFRPKEDEILNIRSGQIDYIRCQYDTRQSNPTYQWILSLYNYVRYTNDIEALKRLMPKARKALLFLTHALEGEKGLLDISYLYGHNGIGMYKKENGRYNFDTINGVGNGYWDLTVSSEKCLEANIYFYQALCAMADLEQRLIDAKVEISEKSIVRNRMPGGENVEYKFTVKSLNNLASIVKLNMQKEIKPVQNEDGGYDNLGGFWNSTTGRFASGINEETGAIADYGYVYWNLEAICAGIGTDEQQLSIMQWIDGQRTVAGDTSTGDDIYFYEFAPRFNTKDAYENLSPFAYATCNPFVEDCGTSFSKQVQNGGAVIAWTYYDIVARAKVLGADNAYARLQKIQTWYEKVQAAGGEGYEFYSAYYDTLAEETNKKTWGIFIKDKTAYGRYDLQQAETTGAGAIGLDAEFIESITFIKAIPDAFLGMETIGHNAISFKNNMPTELSLLQLNNLKFGDCVYNVRASANLLQIIVEKIEENGSIDGKVTIKFAEPSTDYKVYINEVETTDYVVENGEISVTVDFGNVCIKVK
ncbi:MAG: hypothetical protein IJW64_02560 [Clostridia bacterium]|nr:hypothetical protein [Clostridia bacterium]